MVIKLKSGTGLCNDYFRVAKTRNIGKEHDIKICAFCKRSGKPISGHTDWCSRLRIEFVEIDERRVYAREQLGISPRKARGLLRMARVASTIPALHAAWAAGRLSWVQAQTILPVLVARPEEAARWIEHAASVSVRRLEDEIEARERQTGAQATEGEEESCEVFWLAPADVARLFRATLCSVRRRIERATGRLPSEGEAFGALLDHAFVAWGGDERRVRAAWRVFARDGWRCTIPGCSSYRNLHDHHIHFRSAGGSNDEANRTTLCAWHHLRGVHVGRVRVAGRAPAGLRFELGLRAGRAPLLSYVPGA